MTAFLATMPGCSFPSPSSLLPSSGPNEVMYILLYDAMEWVMRTCQKGRDSCHFCIPYRFPCSFSSTAGVDTSFMSRGARIMAQKSNEQQQQQKSIQIPRPVVCVSFLLKPLQAFQITHLVKTYYCSDTDLIVLLNLNHFLVSWDLIKKTITALNIKMLWRSGYTCDSWDA